MVENSLEQRARKKEKKISRRKFLKIAGGAAATLALEACLPKRPEKKVKIKVTQKPKEKEKKVEISEIKMRLGDEEKVSLPGLSYVPDGHTSFIKDETGKIKLWVAAGPLSFLFEGESLETLGTPSQVLEPKYTTSEKGYNGYASFGTIIPGEKPNELIGFFHQEHWENESKWFPYTASIGVTKSTDGGRNFGKRVTIIEGKSPEPYPGERVSGAGQPSAILVGNEVYLYFIDWDGPHSIHLAKTRLDSVDKPETWQRYNGKGFGRPGEKKDSVPVITPPNDRENTGYTSLPGISHNTYLDRYLAVFETNIGFYLAISEDGINWELPQLIFEFPQPQFPIEPGNTWYSYPTLLSPEASSDRETRKTGYLYYSRGVRDEGPHYMHRRPFKLE